MPRQHKAALPDKLYGGSFDPLTAALASTVALLTAPVGATKAQVRDVERRLLAQAIAAQTWPDTAATWDDCRRNLAATLRTLADALEASETSE